MSINHYKRTLREVESPRQIERRIMANVTGRLSDYCDRYEAAESSFERLSILSDGLRVALTDNLALWNALKHDLADPGNALPPELRAGLLSLAIWVEKTTTAVLGGQTGLRTLAQVNHNIVTALGDQNLKMSA